MENFGDILFDKTFSSRLALLSQGEIAQLSYYAFEHFTRELKKEESKEFTVKYPIGVYPDKSLQEGTFQISKEELLDKFNYIESHQLPVSGVYQLVTITEALLGDIIRSTLRQFPGKIPSKRQFSAETILNAESIIELHETMVNAILNDLAYKSPREFGEEFEKMIGIKLLQEPVFHRYIELKATRDIYIHNFGIANSIYVTKASTLARVQSGVYLPINFQYFWESYEACLKLTEILEKELHKIWPSVKYLQNQKREQDSIKPEAPSNTAEK